MDLISPSRETLRYDRVPTIYMSERQHSTRRSAEVEEGTPRDPRGASWNCRLHFLFSVRTSGGECFLLRYSVQSSARANVGASWGNCDHRTSRRPPFYLPFSSLGPVVHSTGKFPFQFTGTSSPADDAPQEASCRSFYAAEMDARIFRSFVAGVPAL